MRSLIFLSNTYRLKYIMFYVPCCQVIQLATELFPNVYNITKYAKPEKYAFNFQANMDLVFFYLPKVIT